MKHINIIIALMILWLLPQTGKAQQYTGISGLVHVPSAEMHHEGDALIGAHFLNKSMMPDTGFLYNGEKYKIGGTDTYLKNKEKREEKTNK